MQQKYNLTVTDTYFGNKIIISTKILLCVENGNFVSELLICYYLSVFSVVLSFINI